MKQKELILNRDWDILLVFDACRYDYFKRYYTDKLNGGTLRKCISPSTFTFGWMKEMFSREMEDVIFISTEPVKDKIYDATKRMKHGKDFDTNDYFCEVIDLHSKAYVEPGLIYPVVVNDAIEKTIKYHPNKKIVAKYWQIHDPYIFWLKKGPEYRDMGISSVRLPEIRKILYNLISDETYWTIMSKLNFKPENWLNALWLKHGVSGIIQGYCMDLLLTLDYMKKIIKKYPEKKVAITSDHGERLGEYGKYSHGGKRTKVIKEIPWYESWTKK